MRYSDGFKEQMVRRLVGPDAVSALALSREVGVGQPTLSRWLRASLGRMSRDEGQRLSKALSKRTPEERAALVLEAKGLNGAELGAFLRRHGLHEADLETLKQWLAERLDPKTGMRERDENKKARKAEQKRIKRLESELRKKDKALAEAAALLVLQKKVQALWGDEDSDMTGRNGD